VEETGGGLIRFGTIGKAKWDLGVGSIAIGCGEELLMSQSQQ
jgi:hypothetical protein